MALKKWTTCGGEIWTVSPKLCGGHTLIAGITGSGKSVLINRLLCDCLATSPGSYEFILIDPKRVELQAYKQTKQCLKYASEPAKIVAALDFAIQVMESRYKYMQARGQKEYQYQALLVVIDELADLMTTNRKECLPRLQRIAQLGRAAKVYLLAATQSPSRKTIPAELVLNFQNRVALRCAFPIESRQIIGSDLACGLPQYGQAYWYTNRGELFHLTNIPPADPATLAHRLEFWRDRSILGGLFK